MLKDLKEQFDDKPFVNLACAHYYGRIKPAAALAGVGTEDLDAIEEDMQLEKKRRPIAFLSGFTLQNNRLLEHGWMFFHVIHKSTARVTRIDSDLIAQRKSCFILNQMVVEVVPVVGADP